MTRTKRVYVWLTDQEFEYLMKNVKKSGLCRETYLRHLIEGYEVKEAPTAEWVQLIHLLSGMANNLNQIARMSHATGTVADWGAIQQIRDDVRDIFGKVKNV
ncbi:plasmid mobilization relaxosome protein MobC [Oscillibacter sp.]|uniref:plasmid mobilization protein n=1 Tax=Oscillibacter sp. TaxID=1945593 RepID=UPI00261EFD9E|nr:plasmid mobilization relaxosome protein MobC [Oscillibacter sp.]MDD3346457.1 plasmid mobilization relaxosome protein MobC [Oscillibacter sp.]